MIGSLKKSPIATSGDTTSVEILLFINLIDAGVWTKTLWKYVLYNYTRIKQLKLPLGIIVESLVPVGNYITITFLWKVVTIHIIG